MRMIADKCKQFDDLITMLVWGDEIPPRDKRRLEKHLQKCAYCQESLEITRRIWREAEARPAVEVPDWVMEETTERIQRTIRELEAEQLENRRAAKRRLLWVPIAAAAGFIIATLWIGLAGKVTPPAQPAPLTGQAPKPDVQVEPLPAGREGQPAEVKPALAKAEDSLDQFKTPAEALAHLQKLFAAARTGKPDREKLMQTITLAGELANRWPNSQEGLKARRLIVDCYYAAGEGRMARAAFVVYAQSLGSSAQRHALRRGVDEVTAKREAEEATANALYGEGHAQFGQQDYLGAIFLFDALIRKCPGAGRVAWAQFNKGEACVALGDGSRAIEAFREATKCPGKGIPVRRGYDRLSEELVNSGQTDEAIKAMQARAKRLNSPAEKAYAEFRIGMFHFTRGETHYPEALRSFRKILKDYPDDPYAVNARGMVKIVQRKIVGHMPDL